MYTMRLHHVLEPIVIIVNIFISLQLTELIQKIVFGKKQVD